MNRGDLLDMVKMHSFLGSADSAELNEIISLYPWFQSVYTLLLDAHYSTDSISFEESLKKNAVFVADREVLYYILRDSDNKAKGEILEKSVPAQTADLDDQGLRSKEDLRAQIESRLEEIGKAPQEKQIKENEIEVVKNEEELDSTEILMLDENEDIISGYEEEKIDDRHKSDEDLLDLDYPEADEEEEKAPSADELVSRFIELNPRIKPDREKMEEPVEDIAEKVEDKNPGLITETLALIYINQKFYTRAILIYEKLSLKFPEKSSYFATQIEKIKELMS